MAIRKSTVLHPPNSLRQLRRARELTMDQLGEMIGVEASRINKLEKGTLGLTQKYISPLTAVLGVTADELLAKPTGVEPVGAPPRARRSDVRPAAVTIPPFREMPNDLPVRGTAAGSHLKGAFQFDAEGAVDYVRRPPALMGARNAYALFVENTSMEPEHRHGDLRFVHPDRPVRKGDSVIVQIQLGENEPVEATIGHFVSKTATMLKIAKLNPEATVELKLDTVKAYHKVLTLNDLFGV